jgi:hypothetical protein
VGRERVRNSVADVTMPLPWLSGNRDGPVVMIAGYLILPGCRN